MALVDADFENIGDIFEIKLDAIVQVVSFDSFTDNITGETIDKYLDKEFRYSTDNVTWGSWTELTNPNLAAITPNPLAAYFFEIRYTRAGSDATGVVTWNDWTFSVTVDLTIDTSFCGAVFSIDNIFCDLQTNDPAFNELCGNLLDKVIKYGIVPKYISGEDGERTEDYKAFWKPICCWFALHFIFAKQFANIYTTVNLLSNFLKERGMFLCSNEDIIEVQTLANNYYNEIRRRGTVEGESEIKRLLCSQDCDEFIMALVQKFEGGWVVNRASPLYKGTGGIELLNKMPETKHDVVDLNNYHLINDGFISIVSDTDNDGLPVDVMNVDQATTPSGITQSGGDSSLKMLIDPSLNYEISFFVKTTVLGSRLKFGVQGWDCDGVALPFASENIITGGGENDFIRNGDVIKQVSKYVHVRGILYNFSEPLLSASEGVMSFGYGRNLRSKSNLAYIYPKIQMFNGASVPLNSTNFYGVRVAVATNPYSLGFVNLATYLVSYFKYRNEDLSSEEINKLINKYMIPANTTISNTVEL